MDYRFRAEQDWNSRKPDGSYRDDKSRLRYRFRAGATYTNKPYSFGVIIRTGDQNKQQDPQLTLGKGLKEFGTLPIGFERIYFKYDNSNFNIWLGKNTYPFTKSNELFWSDNVFPEGVSVSKKFKAQEGVLKNVSLIAGHFILASNNGSFLDDAYFQGGQINWHMSNDQFEISSAMYRFGNIPDIPDGGHSFEMPYSIFHLRGQVKVHNFLFDLDYYNNLNNYDDNNHIEEAFKNQKTGLTIGVQYGNLNTAKKFMYKLTYAYLERYAILDYMAQNDWARWDYAASNSPDGRLSNLKGIEAVIAYAITEKINVVSKYYFVEQLIPYGAEKENGQRIRFDINIRI